MYAMILNPVSGTAKASDYVKELGEIMQKRNLEYTVIVTDENSGARTSAEKALKMKPEAIIALGGDGTISEIVNVIHNSPIPLLIIPCGTGNDFTRMLKLPKEPGKALEVQLDTKARKIDMGRVNDRYFLNVAGTGFDVDVLKCAEKYKQKYIGFKRYFYGLLDAIRYYKPACTLVSVDDGPYIEHRNAIVSIGNGRYFGGGMQAVPNAVIDDGLFDLIMVKPVKKFMILPLIVLYIMGKHLSIGLAEEIKCKRVRIKCNGMTVNMDGELAEMDFAEFEIMPGALTIQTPE